MLSILITAIITFFVCGFFGYVVHRSLHQPWAGQLNKLHMTHHLKLYPPTDYLSDVYRNAGKDNTTRVFALAATPLIVLPIILGMYDVISVASTATAFVVMCIMGLLHDYLHDSFHIRGHFLNRVPIFKNLFIRWNNLHYQHHVNMQCNLGIFNFLFDRLFGTFSKAK